MIPAASVLALRGDPELRVLMVRRTPKSRSWAGLWVFPGGRIEAGEDVPVAAARELFEETGLLLADGSSRAMTLAQDSREAVHAGEVAFMDVVSASGLVFERARLAPVSRWQTPSFEKRRFDAHFFVSDASFLGAPCLDAVVADASETVEERWWSPADILGRYYANELE
ncbi:MAG: NUDIX domain-containing protein, partial [Myxococcota bacterium]